MRAFIVARIAGSRQECAVERGEFDEKMERIKSPGRHGQIMGWNVGQPVSLVYFDWG